MGVQPVHIGLLTQASSTFSGSVLKPFRFTPDTLNLNRTKSRCQPSPGGPVHTDHSTIDERPRPRAIVRHLSLSLLTATVIPSALFAVCLAVGSVWCALIAALVWCYGSMAYRASRGHRMSGMLLVTAAGLTAKTIFTFASGDTFVYFAQPAVTDMVVAGLYIGSLATARPLVDRLAADFFPMEPEVSTRPTVQRLFWRLSMLWAGVCVLKAAVTLSLLYTLPTGTMYPVKEAMILTIVIGAATLTARAAFRVAHAEGLLHSSAVAPA
jgi:hypothetical protein